MHGFRNPIQYNNIHNINNNMVFKSYKQKLDIVVLYNNIITIY